MRYVVAQDDNCQLELEQNDTGHCLVHLNVGDNTLTLSQYKEWKWVWDRVKDILKDKGHNEVFAIIATEEPIAVHKLSQSFGFYAILKISNAIVYRQEL